MAKQVKIKKLLKTEDAFLSTSERVYNFFLTHTNQFIFGALGLIVILAVILVIIQNRSSNLEKAAFASQEAMSVVDPEASIAALSSVIEKYPGAPSSRAATLALAAAQGKAKNFAQAAETLEGFVKTLKPGEDSLKALVLVSLGQYYEELGQLDKASANYRSAQALANEFANVSQAADSLKTELYVAIGRVQAAAGQIGDSASTYQSFRLAYPTRGSFLDFMAQHRLAVIAATSAKAAPKVAESPAGSAPAGANATDNSTAESATAATDNATSGANATAAADNATAESATGATDIATAESATAAADNATAERVTAATESEAESAAESAAAEPKAAKKPAKPKPKSKPKPKPKS
jgi:predicted negative regulator of RcsB-dependent stress response